MIRRILVPLDLSPSTETATSTACMLARAHSAEVTAIVILNTDELIEKSTLPFHQELRDYTRKGLRRLKAEAEEKIEASLSLFRERCEAAGVEHRETEFQGIPEDRIVEASVYYDLIVMGQRSSLASGDTVGTRALETVLGRAVTGILAVPDSPLVLFPKNVLVAFDGSFHAGKALRELVRLCGPLDFEITLLSSDSDANRAKAYLEEAHAYLQSHGIGRTRSVVTGEDIMDVVDKQYLEWADMVVAGIHTKRPLRDLFIGSFTQHLIESGAKPLLLA